MHHSNLTDRLHDDVKHWDLQYTLAVWGEHKKIVSPPISFHGTCIIIVQIFVCTISCTVPSPQGGPLYEAGCASFSPYSGLNTWSSHQVDSESASRRSLAASELYVSGDQKSQDPSTPAVSRPGRYGLPSLVQHGILPPLAPEGAIQQDIAHREDLLLPNACQVSSWNQARPFGAVLVVDSHHL